MQVDPFKLCLYSNASSGSRQSAAYEPAGITIMLTMLKKLRKTSGGGEDRVVYLDTKANVGNHVMPVAMAGFQAWAVEPDPTSMFKVRKIQ